MTGEATTASRFASGLSVGVIGAGSIGTRHIRNLSALGTGDIIATDPDLSRRDIVTAIDRVRWAASAGEVLSERPDVVFVCTPTHLHAEGAIAALAAGAHVFIEKPIAVTLDDADRIVDAVEAHDRVVMVGCNMRFHPGVAAIKRAVDDGIIGRPLVARAEFAQYLPSWRPEKDYRKTYSAKVATGGGIILECVHEFDYLRWIGGEITGVAGSAAKVSELEVDGEDTADIALRFANGMIAEMHLDYLRYDKRRGCEILGTDGIVSWRSYGGPPERVEVKYFAKASKTWTDLEVHPSWDGNRMYVDETIHFLDCLANGNPPMLDADGGREVLRIALASRSATTLAWHGLE